MDPLYGTTALIAVVTSLIRPPSFLIDTFFPTVTTFETQEVTIDIEVRRRRVAAFSAPMTEGKVVTEQGFETDTFQPAYTKELTPLKPLQSFNRAAGEVIGGGALTPLQRDQLRVAGTLADHVDAITRRKELMAVEALVKGQVTVKGEGYKTKVVKFRRNPALQFVNLGNDKWDGSDADPLSDLQRWVATVHRIEGAVITHIVMDSDAWDACWKAETFKAAMETRHFAVNTSMDPSSGAIMIGPQVAADGVLYKGMIGALKIYVYSEWYEDPDTHETRPYLESGTVIGASIQIEGAQLQGAILDIDAGLRALEYFPKSWVIPNPSARMMLTQSAPLVVPKRSNASFGAKVL